MAAALAVLLAAVPWLAPDELPPVRAEQTTAQRVWAPAGDQMTVDDMAASTAHPYWTLSAERVAQFDRLADCESGDRIRQADGTFRFVPGSARWDIDAYHDGGLQFLPSTWRLAGGDEFAPFAHQASREDQIWVAHRWQERTSWAQWPVCSRLVGLR